MRQHIVRVVISGVAALAAPTIPATVLAQTARLGADSGAQVRVSMPSADKRRIGGTLIRAGSDSIVVLVAGVGGGRTAVVARDLSVHVVDGNRRDIWRLFGAQRWVPAAVPGSRVRVASPGGPAARRVGTLTTLGTDSFAIDGGPISTGQSLEVSEGLRRRAGTGIAIGLGVGGLIAGGCYVLGGNDESEACAFRVLAIGVGVGAVLGGAVRTERWVSLARR